MMKMNRKLKERIKKKIALISLVALLFNTAMVGIFVPSVKIASAVDPVISWPSVWTTPSSCVSDPANDEHPSNLDIVGDSSNPAVGFAFDDNYHYFREKVAGDPSGSLGGFAQNAWVVLFQTSAPYYQYIGGIDGLAEKVQLRKNTTQTEPVDFSPIFGDKADDIPVWEGNTSDYARIIDIGNGNYYVDWAIPVSGLTAGGITTFTTKYFATSADANNYNKDYLNCYESISDLVITKSDSPDPVTQGANLTYTITVSNNGPEDATGVIVTDNLPAGVIYVSSDSLAGTYDNNTGEWNIGTLGNGSNAILNIIVKVNNDTAGTISNTATVVATTPDSNDTNNSATTLSLVNEPECSQDSDCDDGVYCNGQETCNNAHQCVTGTSVDCSNHNIFAIGTCTNDPDNNPFTWDSRNLFTSQCDEGTDSCTIGDTTVTSTCNVTDCQAQCDITHPCPDTNCHSQNSCVGNDYYTYSDVQNSCLGDCTCETNQCGAPTISYDDARCTQCQIDSDCDGLDSNYCDGTVIKHDEGVCVDFACVAQTSIVQDCDNGLYCDGQETCSNAQCVSGTPVDCSNHNIFAIGTCTNDPDNNPFTWDFRNLFTSQCDEVTDICTTGDTTVTSTCDEQCGAACVSNEDCNDQNPNTTDTCNLTSCECEHTTSISEGDIIINELMWMGSANSDYDEWIELKNTTQLPIENLNGCYLNRLKGGIEELMLNIPDGFSIGEDEHYLISNYDNDNVNSNIDVVPNLVDTDVSLLNGELEIKLYCGQTLIDTAGNGGDPLAGYNGSSDPVIPKKSMSRKAIVTDGDLADSWCTAVTQENWDAGTTEFGTPGEPNVCNYISGYKFNDENGDGDWNSGEMGEDDWTIELYNSINGLINNLIDSEETAVGDLGHYEFINLIAGTYFVQEILQNGWTNTTGNPVEVNLAEGEDATVNFGNCSDVDNDGICDINDNCINTYNPEQEDIDEDGVGDACDEGQCQEGSKRDCYSGPGGTEGVGICHAGIQTCVDGSWGECDGEVTPQNEICGNGIDEDCNGSDASCGGGGGGGVLIKPTIIITNEDVEYLGNGEALVTWTTNIETTRQVAYGDDSITVLDDAPEYGYDFVNVESIGMTKEHSVTIGGLTDGVVYYFRPIADRNGSTGEKVGIEVSYEFEKEGEVKGIVDPIVPAECNYLLEYIKLGADNNLVEVKKLETFLNEFEGENLAVNGIYEPVDFDAVSRFQEKYSEDILTPWNCDKATGYVYITTKKMINELYCEREFPLTSEQEVEVSAFSSRFLSAPAIGGEVSDDGETPNLTGDSEASTAEDIEEGMVGGAETEIGEELTGVEVEGEEDERPEEIKIEIEDKDEDTEVASSNYSRYFWIILALIILVLAYRFYNSRKTKQGEDTQ